MWVSCTFLPLSPFSHPTHPKICAHFGVVQKRMREPKEVLLASCLFASQYPLLPLKKMHFISLSLSKASSCLKVAAFHFCARLDGGGRRRASPSHPDYPFLLAHRGRNLSSLWLRRYSAAPHPTHTRNVESELLHRHCRYHGPATCINVRKE